MESRGSNLPTLRIILAASAPALCISILVLTPFLAKPFTVDDVTFLLQARHVLQDPLNPTTMEMVFHGIRIRLSQLMVNGPVMAYALVPSILLDGAEWVAHLVQLLFLIVAILATTSLAFRLGLDRTQATVAGLLVATTSAVLALTTTAMPDVPAMALGVLGIERTLAWQQNRKWGCATIAALCLALAALSRLHAVLLVPCVLILALPQDGPLSTARIVRSSLRGAGIPVLLALGLTLSVNHLLRDDQAGIDVAAAALAMVGTGDSWRNLANFFLQWTIAFPLALLWIALRGWQFLRSGVGVASVALGIWLSWRGGYLAFAPLIALATAVVFDIVRTGWNRVDPIQLGLGAWLLIGAAGTPYIHLPAKYLVPSVPAMALLLARFPASRLISRRAVLVIVSFAGIVLGVLIILADRSVGEIGRIGGSVVAQHRAGDHAVWMDGANGFQWYAMQAGATPLAETPPAPSAGDLVVTGPRARVLALHYPYRTLVSRKVFNQPGGRVFGKRAEFYGPGPLPWRWGTDEIGRIEVWRIDSLPTP